MSRTLLIVALAGLLNQAPSSALFDTPQLLKDLQTLSADDMQGRQVGTEGGEKARQYIIGRFKQLKLTPIGDSYEYPFTFGGNQGERRGVNVVARIDGTARKDRYVVVSAHYDHIGVRNGVVNNGADDNASGTAALFAVAQYFLAHRPQHSIVLVAFDGEEAGLRGAGAFVKTPPVDLASIGVNVNMDMIGRDADDKLFAVGSRLYPFLRPLLERASEASPLKLLFGHEDPNQRGDDWTRDSDHYAFHQVKIPFVYLGVEDEAQHHKSTDDYETMTYAFYVKAVETSIQVVKVFDAELENIMKQGSGR